MKRRHLILAFICIIIPPAFPCQAEEPDLTAFFHALAQVESNHDDNAVGDGGASIGRYQIQRPYWLDATEFTGIGGRYEDVRDKAYAERIMRAYWKRYCPRAYRERDYETLARTHNGGPRGHKKRATLAYWEKVKAALND